MMAMSKKIADQEPGDVEVLLPWHAAGTLNARDTRRIEDALGSNPELARQYASIREEYAETILLNESLGAPSSRAMTKLFAAIDAEPAPRPRISLNVPVGIAEFFARLSPRTLAAVAGLGAVALLLQAGVIGAVLMKQQAGEFQSASPSSRERGLAMAQGPVALVRFAPDARVADVTAFLDSYHASIVDGARNGMFRLQFAATTPQDFAGLLTRLQNEKIISLAVAAQ
jgi:anti-sigma factor RsiW